MAMCKASRKANHSPSFSFLRNITCWEAAYLRTWEMLRIMVHPQNIDAHFRAGWQPESSQLCGFTCLSDLQFDNILHCPVSHILTADSGTHIYGLLWRFSNACCMSCHEDETYKLQAMIAITALQFMCCLCGSPCYRRCWMTTGICESSCYQPSSTPKLYRVLLWRNHNCSIQCSPVQYHS